MDQKSQIDRQIGDLLIEFKNRITAIPPFPGMPGSQGYSMKINRQDVDASLEIYINSRFPYEPPICMVKPLFHHEIVDNLGRINDDCLRLWNMNSSLKNVVKDVLAKLEMRAVVKQNAYGMLVSNVANNPNTDEQILTKDLTAELSKKSIEELIYINFNPEHFVYEFTEQGRNANEKLLNEVKELNSTFEMKKNQYEMIRGNVENCKKQYEDKEKTLRDLYNQKNQMDNAMTVDKLIEEINNYINENFQKPRQKLLNDFMNKKIENFDEFKDKYKDLSYKYHYYCIIRDKLNLCK